MFGLNSAVSFHEPKPVEGCAMPADVHLLYQDSPRNRLNMAPRNLKFHHFCHNDNFRDNNGNRGLPDVFRRLPDEYRLCPDAHRQLPDGKRHYPNAVRRLPDDVRHVPDERRQLPDDHRHRPDDFRMNPGAYHHRPDGHRCNPDGIRPNPDRPRSCPCRVQRNRNEERINLNGSGRRNTTSLNLSPKTLKRCKQIKRSEDG